MIRMKAIRQLTYRTRRLLADGTSEEAYSLAPGDIFEVKPRDRRLVLATKKAELVREPANVPPPPPALAAKIAAAVAPDDRPALRAEYERVLGKAPWVGWNADQLREKIADASKE